VLYPEKGLLYDQPLLDLDILKRDYAKPAVAAAEEGEGESEGEEREERDDGVGDVYKSLRVLRCLGDAPEEGAEETMSESEDEEREGEGEDHEAERTGGRRKRWRVVDGVEISVGWERSGRRERVVLVKGDCVMMNDEQGRPYFARIDRISSCRQAGDGASEHDGEAGTGVSLTCSYFYAAHQTVMGPAGRKIMHERELYASNDVGQLELECVQAKVAVRYIDNVTDWSVICGHDRDRDRDALMSAPAPAYFYRYVYSAETHVFVDAKRWSRGDDPTQQDDEDEEGIEDYFGSYEEVLQAREESMKRCGRWSGYNPKQHSQRMKYALPMCGGACACACADMCRQDCGDAGW
jgi:hypothetical protein